MSLAALLKATAAWDEDEERDAQHASSLRRSAAAPGGTLAAILEATAGDEGTEDDTAAPGTVTGTLNSARRGVRQAGQSIDAATIGQGVEMAHDADQEPARVAQERAEDPEPKREPFDRYGDDGDRVYTISLRKWQQRNADRDERLRNNARFAEGMRRDSIPQLAGAIGRRQQEIEALPQTEGKQQFDEAQGFVPKLQAAARHPIDSVAGLVAESLPASSPSLAMGALGSAAGPVGTAFGAGGGSLMMEYGSKVLEELQAAGVDLQKPETIAALAEDPERMAAIREKSIKRGIPVAVFDAISSGIAGRLLRTPGKTMLAKLGNAAAEMGIQGGMGGAGEAAGSIAAGDKVDMGAVLSEILAEVGSGSQEIATGAARDRIMGNAAAASSARDTGQNIPESRTTLEAQQQQLLEGRRPAQMFPAGTDELPLPEGMERIETPRGVFHFNPAEITRDQIREASAAGRENDVLALGPNSKADVAEHTATGEPEIAVTERQPDGAEVKGAVSTPSLAPETVAALEQTKTPGNTIQAERVDQVLADRVTSEKETPPTNSPRGKDPQHRGALARLLRETEDKPTSPGGALQQLLRETEQDEPPTPAQPQSTAPTLTDEQAAAELSAIRKAFPELTRQYDIEISLVEDALRRRGYKGTVPEKAQAAVLRRTQAQRSLIVLGARSYRDRQKGAALLTHEIAHPFWDTLPDKTKAQLRAMHVLEVENKSGPLYQGGQLRTELAFTENMDENGAKEWFAERVARLNEDWAKGRMDRAEQTLLRQLAQQLREYLRHVWATMAHRDGISAEDRLFVDQFRQFFTAGADAEVGRRAGEAYAQQLDAPRVPVNTAAAPAFATSKPDTSGRAPATRAELLAALKRARALRDAAINAGDAEKETDGIRTTAAIRNELDERFPGWEKAATSHPIDATKNPAAAAAHLRGARQRLVIRADSAFRSDISEPVPQDLDILADLRDYAEQNYRENEDFVAFADRMRADLGERITPYLPDAWDAVSGGRPLRDIYVSDNPLRVDEAWKRAVTYGRLFFEGAADVLRRNKFTALADAIDRHVDLGDRNFANAWSIIGPAISKYQGLTGLARRPRAKRVLDEWSAYFTARESGNPAEAKFILEKAHPDTRQLIDATRQLFEFTGYQNERLGIMVYDPKIEGIRRGGNLGAEYFPRMLREEVNSILRDPSTNPKLWEQMKLQLLENGNIQTSEEAGTYLKNNIPRETIDDFFSNLEMARSAKLPDSWYETDFLKVIPRFVTSWAERSAQIEAFGQKIGEEGKDAFDRAVESTRNEAAQRYIEATREHAYRVSRLDPSTRKIVGNITSATSALFLGNPYSTLRNLVGGTAQAVNQFGGVRALRALRQARGAMTDAQAAGALKADIADMLFQGDSSGPVREFTNLSLKLGGFNAAEQVVRATNFLMAKTFLRDAFAHFRRNPGSRASLQAAALMQRYGFDPQALLAENLKGPETDRFLRASVREAQGGYRYNQVPLFLNSPAGRFVAQFARWGTMAARFHVRNVVAPAIIGESVRVRVGDKVTEKRVRTILPLLRSPFVAMAAGALTYAAREALFGADRMDPGWDEIFKTYDEDDQRAIELALSRMTADVIMGGSYGAISDYAGMLKEAATRGRYKNPIEPPAASILKEIGVLAYKRAQQGQLTAEDYQQFASRVLTAYRYGRAIVHNFSDRFGLDAKDARLFRADLDKRFTRAAGNRFAEEMGFDIPAFNSGGMPSVNENTPFYSRIEDALLSGDSYEAAQQLRRELAPLAGKKRTARLSAIRTSILGRQPLKAGGRSAEEIQREFIGWARRRLTPGEQRRMFETQRRYLDTALRAGLITPESHASRTQYLPRVATIDD